MNTDETQDGPDDAAPRLRRFCIRFAIAMTWLAFSVFILGVAREIQKETRDSGALPSLLLLGSAMGIAHGLHGRLKRKKNDSDVFETTPSRIDIVFISVSIALFLAGATLSMVRAFG